MTNSSTLWRLLLLATTFFGAHTTQAQITLDGRITAAEKGPGLYQSMGRFTGQHGFGNWGMVEAFVGYDANYLYVAVQGTVETNGNAFQIWYNVPARAGRPAGALLPGAYSPTGDQTSFSTTNLGTFDFEVDGAIAYQYASGQGEVEMADLTSSTPASQVLGLLNDNGAPASFLTGAVRGAYHTSPTGDVTSNTNEGFEVAIARAALGLVSGQTVQLFVLMNNADGGYASSDFIPEGPVPGANGAWPNMGPEPDFTTVPGNQYFDFNLGNCALAAPTLTSNSPQCAGQTLTLTASGVPTGATYSWTGPNGFAATTLTVTIQNAPVAASGTYTLTISQNGCQRATSTNVMVGAAPQASISASGPTTFCQGGAVILTASPGTAYLWSNGATTPNLTVTAPGPYSVTITNAGGCSATSPAVLVTQVAPPTAAFAFPAPTLCTAQAPLVPTITGTAGGSFSAQPAGLVLNPATGLVTPAVSQPGTYVVTYSVASSGTCPGAAASTVLTVEAPPATPIIAVQALPGGSVLLTSSNPSGNQWYLNGQPIAGATSFSYLVTTPAQNGTYTVQTTSAAGCTSALSAAQAVALTGTAAELAGASLSLFPNPTPDGRVAVQLTGFGESVTLRLLDLTGRTILSQEAPADATVPLDLTARPAGVYMLRATTAHGTLTRRLVR